MVKDFCDLILKYNNVKSFELIIERVREIKWSWFKLDERAKY